MDPFQLAQLIAAANAAPTGGGDLTHDQGEIVTWDESTGLNSVKVNGVVLSNLRVLQSGIGVTYQPGDTVMVERRMSQRYIVGKVAAPGASAGNQIVSAEVVTSQTTGSTSYTDLATPGPSATVYIGSSRRCLVLFGCGITVADTGAGVNNYIGGSAVIDVLDSSGATVLAAAAGVSAQIWSPSGAPTGGAWTSSKPKLLTGLQPGTTTFKMRYKSNLATPQCGFIERHITAIPF